MRKTKLWITIIITLIMLVTVSLFFIPYLQSIGGFSTLSLSKASLKSESQYLDGEQWILTVTQGTLAQKVQGIIKPEDVGAVTGNEKTENNFEISVDYQDQSCEYPIQNNNLNEPIYKLEKIEWLCAFTPSEEDALEKLEENGLFREQGIGYKGKYNPGISCFAMYWTEKTPIANYGASRIRSKMNVAVLAGSRSDDVNLDTLGDAQAPLSDFAYVIWVGNLDSGKDCDSTSSYLPAYKSGNWININRNSYDRYLNKYDNRPSSRTKSDIEGYISEVNNAATNAIVSQSFGSFENIGSFENAILKKILVSPNQFPVLTFYVKAETLGVYTPAPEIELLDASSPVFSTGDQGIIYVTAKNIGDEQGTWNFYGDCDGNFEITESRQYSIDAGLTKKISLPISASADKKTSGKCTIYAENIAGTESIDVTVTVDPLQTCTPSQKFCGTSGGFDVIFQCSNDGVTKQIAEICKVDQVCENAKCGEGGGSGFTGWFKNLFSDISDFFKEFVLIISIIIGLISALVGYSLYERLSKLAKFKYNKTIAIIVGLLLGLLAGYLFYSLFWIGVIALIVYLVILVIIKSIKP